MAKTETEIIVEIEEYIENWGGVFSNWYVGITADVEDRLFNDHSVKKEGGVWIYSRTSSSSMARRIEKYFIDRKGTQGGPGGGDENSIYVYAYKINYYTKE